MSFLDDYEPVEDRLREFWHRHPAGKVTTELLAYADGDYIVMARLYRGDELREDRPAATGLAHDSVAQLPANMKSSALEVCETSAIGRALANLGFAAKGKRPSREEMQKSGGALAHPAGGGRGNSGGSPPPANPSAPSEAPERQPGTRDEGAASAGLASPGASDPPSRGQGGGLSSSPPCPHLHLDPLKADGKPYPKGYARCLDCGVEGVRVAA